MKEICTCGRGVRLDSDSIEELLIHNGLNFFHMQG